MRSMRKRIIPAISVRAPLEVEHWIDLEGCAEIEVSSENAAHPIDAALLPGNGGGWRANEPGPQTVRILFDAPRKVTRMRVVVTEDRQQRTQEFVLRWAPAADGPWREIVRQQYNFVPLSSEVEEYAMELDNVGAIELQITPSISGGEAVAGLAEWRIG